jgi:hypothetical protein
VKDQSKEKHEHTKKYENDKNEKIPWEEQSGSVKTEIKCLRFIQGLS